MKSFQRERLNICQWAKDFHGLDVNNLNSKVRITYDKTLNKGDYSIIRQQNHDGTLLFTVDMLSEILELLVNGRSYYRLNELDRSKKLSHIQYTIGDMKIITTWKEMNGKGLRQRERFSLPVVCDFIYKD